MEKRIEIRTPLIDPDDEELIDKNVGVFLDEGTPNPISELDKEYGVFCGECYYHGIVQVSQKINMKFVHGYTNHLPLVAMSDCTRDNFVDIVCPQCGNKLRFCDMEAYDMIKWLNDHNYLVSECSLGHLGYRHTIERWNYETAGAFYADSKGNIAKYFPPSITFNIRIQDWKEKVNLIEAICLTYKKRRVTEETNTSLITVGVKDDIVENEFKACLKTAGELRDYNDDRIYDLGDDLYTELKLYFRLKQGYTVDSNEKVEVVKKEFLRDLGLVLEYLKAVEEIKQVKEVSEKNTLDESEKTE